MHEPKKARLDAALRVVHYVKANLSQGLMFLLQTTLIPYLFNVIVIGELVLLQEDMFLAFV